MLKRIVRNRIYVALVAILFVVGGMWLPLRHNYSTFDSPDGHTYDQTEVLYGAPYVWYNSVKTTDQDTGKAAKHYATKNYNKLLIDTAIWTSAILIVIGASKMADSYLYANTRY
jgi:hypothetical protein